MTTDNTSIKHQVYTSILNAIIRGEYKSDQVINEKKLITLFGVSRAPIREALIELCNEGVLYSIPYYGYKITPLTRDDIQAVQEYRTVLECTYMQRYWHKLTGKNLSGLESIMQEEYGENTEFDALTHWNKNAKFHLKLFSFYESDYALKSLRSALTIQTRAYAQIRWEKWHTPIFSDTSDSHQVLVHSIKNNNITQALHLLETDIMNIFM